MKQRFPKKLGVGLRQPQDRRRAASSPSRLADRSDTKPTRPKICPQFTNIYSPNLSFPQSLTHPRRPAAPDPAAILEPGIISRTMRAPSHIKLASFRISLPHAGLGSLGFVGFAPNCISLENKDFLGSKPEFAYTWSRYSLPPQPYLGRVTPGLAYDIFNASSGFRTQSGGDCPLETIRCHS
jgi:hypothetical protein